MKLLVIAVLLQFSLYSKINANGLAFFEINNEQSEEKKEASNVSDKNSNSENSDSDSTNSENSRSDDLSPDDSNSDGSSADDTSQSAAASSILLNFSRMKFMEETGNIDNQPNTDTVSIDTLTPAASVTRLKYAALSDNEDRKNGNDKTGNNDNDASFDTDKNIQAPRIFSNPRFKKIFGQNAGEIKTPTDKTASSSRSFYPTTPPISEEEDDDDQKASLELTLGGYQRPFQDQTPSVKRTVNIPNPEIKPEDLAQKEEGTKKSQGDYREPQTPFQGRMLPQQGLRYVPNIPDPFSTPRMQYNYHVPEAETGIAFRYPESVQSDFHNQQAFGDPGLDYNTALLERLRSNEINGYLPSMQNYRTDFNQGVPLSNYFTDPSTLDARNAYGTNIPFNIQRSLPIPGNGLQSNHQHQHQPDANLFTGNLGGSLLVNQSPLHPSFLYSRSLIATEGPENMKPNGFVNGYPNGIFHQYPHSPTYIVHRNNPLPNSNPKTIEENNSQKASDDDAQESESVSQEQNQEPNFGSENVYLNYPTKQAGYATQEHLPSQNRSSDSSTAQATDNFRKQAINGSSYGLPGFRQTKRPLERHRFRSFPRSPFVNIDRSSNFPFSQTNFTQNAENNTRAFDSEDFYRNLQSPIQFNYPSPPALETGIYSHFPESSQNAAEGSYFSTGPSFFVGIPNNGPISSPSGISPVPQNPYNFFDNRRKENIDEDQIPDCAKELNASICFQDANYPRNEILHSLDSEALLLFRIVPPVSSVTKSEDDAKGERSSTDEDTNICTSEVRNGLPLRAMNAAGKWKVIVNLGDPTGRFNQNVVLENCKGVGESCSYTDQSISSKCVQKYSSHRLFVWNRDSGLHTDVFELPVSCSCQISKNTK